MLGDDATALLSQKKVILFGVGGVGSWCAEALVRTGMTHLTIVDADKVLTHVPIEEFPAQTLTCELYLEAGIRACEIGYILADRDPVTRENRFSGLDLVRLCIPRRVYTDNHMKVIAAALKNVYDRRETITRGLRITKEAPLMRHFTVELERL